MSIKTLMAAPGPAEPARSWTITVNAPCAWLTANNQSRLYVVQNKLVRAWRGAAYYAATQAKLPTGLARVRIDATARFRGKPPVRDRLNLWPTLKAVVDGLGPARRSRRTNAIGYGLIPDDDDRHLDGPHFVIGEPLPPSTNPWQLGDLVLVITELPALNGATS